MADESLCICPEPLIYSRGDRESEVLEDHIVSICTHPSRDVLAVGDIVGKITFYSYKASEECKVVSVTTPQHGYSCRVLHFSRAGNRIFSGSSQRGTLYCTDVETKALEHSLDVHCTPLYSMLQVSDRLLATGDEEGEVKLWDMRSWKQVRRIKENRDFISDMAVEANTLLATSGDGSLIAVDLRQKALLQRSDTNESELLSLAVVKARVSTVCHHQLSRSPIQDGGKVVCGDGDGALMIYNWGLWNDITDRYPIHPEAIDCMLPLNRSVVCTGCMDGWVRSIQILPNQVLGSVGKHSSGFPVENMCLSHDRKYVVSSCQDSCHFWPTSLIPTLPPHEGEEEEEVTVKRRKRKRKQKHRDLAAEEQARTKKLQQQDFFSDL